MTTTGASSGLDARVEPAPIEDDTAQCRLVSRVQPPPVRQPVPVSEYAGPVTGERVVWQSPRGWHFDLRAASEPYAGADGEPPLVDVVAEVDWYRGVLSGDRGVAVAVLAHTVFLERPPP